MTGRHIVEFRYVYVTWMKYLLGKPVSTVQSVTSRILIKDKNNSLKNIPGKPDLSGKK